MKYYQTRKNENQKLFFFFFRLLYEDQNGFMDNKYKKRRINECHYFFFFSSLYLTFFLLVNKSSMLQIKIVVELQITTSKFSHIFSIRKSSALPKRKIELHKAYPSLSLSLSLSPKTTLTRLPLMKIFHVEWISGARYHAGNSPPPTLNLAPRRSWSLELCYARCDQDFDSIYESSMTICGTMLTAT